MVFDSTSPSQYLPFPFPFPFTLTLAAILATAAALLLGQFFVTAAAGLSHDAREPPLIKVGFPVLGHMVGHTVNLLRYGKRYALMMNKKYNLPIYTMNAINHKFYIVNSPQIATQVHRATKQLSFTPFLSIVAKRISRFTDDEMAKAEKNMFRKEGKEGMIPEMHDMIIKEMSPGAQNLRDMSRVVLEMMSRTVNEVLQEQEEQNAHEISVKSVQLYKWIRQSFVMASMTAFYGPEHPFLNKPGLEQKFWDFERAMNIFVANLAPRLTAPRAFQAREELLEALIDYSKRGGQKQASNMIKERYSIHMQHGLSLEGCARAEVPMLQGVLANATTATFWFLAHAYSTPSLLTDLRTELAGIVELDEGEDDGADADEDKFDGKKTTIIINRFSVETIKKQCPLMVGTYREVLRLLGGLPSTRVVLEDTFLSAQQYLLKAGSTVQIAANVLHADESIWGADVATFNPYRFLTTEQAATIKQLKGDRDKLETENETETEKSIANGNFNTAAATATPKLSSTSSTSSTSTPGPIYSFGGGANLCPGRHFAMIEVLGFTAAMIWALDVTSTAKAATSSSPPEKTMATTAATTTTMTTKTKTTKTLGDGAFLPPECPPENTSDMPTSFSKPVWDVDVLLWARRDMDMDREAGVVGGNKFRVEVVP